MAKKIIKYVANDGTEFATEDEADQHDLRSEIHAQFVDQLTEGSRSRKNWDLSMAFDPEDRGYLVIGLNDLPLFLSRNAAFIQAVFYTAHKKRGTPITPEVEPRSSKTKTGPKFDGGPSQRRK